MEKYKINENKKSEKLKLIGVSSIILCILNIIVSIILHHFDIDIFSVTFKITILLISLAMITLTVSETTSTLDKDTKFFLNEIRKKINEAKTYDEHLVIKHELINECIDDRGLIRLSYPLSIKNLIYEINGKLDLLKKLEEN